MEVRFHHDPREFWSAAGPYFSTDPVRHTLAMTVIRRLVEAPDPQDAEPTLLTIWDDRTLAGAAFVVPPYPLGVSGVPEHAIDDLVSALLDADRDVSGVSGPRDPAESFAQTWAKRTGCTVNEVMPGRLYRLKHLEPPDVPGRSRLAGEDDVPLMAAWRRDFELEAMGHEREPGRAESNVRRSMALGNGAVLWEHDGTVVSYAAAGKPHHGMSRVGPVYTPPECRGRGYGSAITAAASRWAQDAGAKHVVLFTDLTNPISNSIYQRIGYRPVLDTTELEFAGQPEPA